MTLDETVRAIADAVAADLDAKLEAKMDAVRQDLRNAVAGITGEAAIQVAQQNIKGVIEPAIAAAVAAIRAIPTLQAAAIFDVPPREDRDGLPPNLQFGTRFQEDQAYAFAKVLRELLNDPTFPQSDPLAPKQ